ncbi:MAG: hypothetical protein GXO86_02655 [Chlorobi bacterium]|nr:hypothetical protein [Chlorobiota bacterium]
MKKLVPIILFSILFVAGRQTLYAFGAQDGTATPDTTLTKKEIKKAKRKEERKNLKPHFRLSLNTTYAFLETQVRFITPGGLVSFQVGLEKNLQMPDQQIIVSSSMIYRITPRSGLYAMYYGLKRNSKHVLNRDIYLPGDTIFAGAYVNTFFNTDVYSFGYLFSILTREKSFLGVFFNLYLMNIRTGIESDIIQKRSFNYQFLAPLPNIGLIMDFELTKWFHLNSGVGTFFVNNIEGVGGTIQDIHFLTAFYPAKWLALSIGFHIFNVFVTSREQDYLLNVSYSFKGPSFSLRFRF